MANLSRVLWCLGLVLVLGALQSSALAQDSKDTKKERPRSGLGSRIGQLLSPEDEAKLKLTDEQKEKVAKLQKEFREQNKETLDKLGDEFGKIREALRKARADQDRDSARKAMQDLRGQFQSFQKLRDQFDAKLSALLTDEQKKLYEELRKERSPRSNFGGRRAGGRPNPRSGGSQPGASGLLPREIQADLSPEQKDKLAKLQKEVETRVLSILTDEQKKRYDELQKGRSSRDRKRPEAQKEEPVKKP
jgi:Spy/CpxP family protein refolding chaperone